MCVACLAVNVGELAWRQAEARSDYAFAGATLDQLGRVGRDNELARLRLGRRLFEQGEVQLALHQFEVSSGLEPTPNAFGGLGRAREAMGELGPALEAYQAGLALEPRNAGLLRRSGFLALRLGQPGRAIELLERSLEFEPDHPSTRDALRRAQQMQSSG